MPDRQLGFAADYLAVRGPDAREPFAYTGGTRKIPGREKIAACSPPSQFLRTTRAEEVYRVRAGGPNRKFRLTPERKTGEDGLYHFLAEGTILSAKSGQ